MLLKAIGAKRVLEVGTLVGYSGVWLARALPADGKLVTIELERRYADLARRGFREAGVSGRVQLIEGDAMVVLPELEPEFDAVFLDADKASLQTYFSEALRLLRVGGLLLGDNAFWQGRILDPNDDHPDVEGVRKFNQLVAEDPRLASAIIPVRDGLTVGVKLAD